MNQAKQPHPHPQVPGSNRRALIGALIAVPLICIGVIGYFSVAGKKAAPDVVFTSIGKEKISSQSLRGKVVVVNFWSMSCGYCLQEMPQLAETHDKYQGKGLALIAVAMSQDSPTEVADYAKTRALPFTVAFDAKGELAKSFGDVHLTPTTFVIDKEGNIIKRYLGVPDFEELHHLLERALAG